MATWTRTSRISSRVQPLRSAALTCSFGSWGRVSALIMARLIVLGTLRESPGRVQTVPQQYSVTSSWRGRVKSSACSMARLTYSSPNTARRTANPSSKRLLDTNSHPLLTVRPFELPLEDMIVLQSYKYDSQYSLPA